MTTRRSIAFVGCFVLAICAVAPSPVFGGGPAAQGMDTHDLPMPCPGIQATLDGVTYKAGKSTVIAIARLGDGEASQRWNDRRLYNVRVYLTRLRGLPYVLGDEQLITATGDRVRGYGRVEIYIQGELYCKLLVPRRKDIQVSECESGHHPVYYSDRVQRPRKVKVPNGPPPN